jgi:hypothetical protein
MRFKFDKRLFFLLSLSFIGFTIIGTLSHEFGHFVIAKTLGYDARINYGYTFWEATAETHSDLDLPNIIDQGSYRIRQIKEKEYRDSFRIALGGPVQTMLTGTIGLLLVIRKKNPRRASLAAKHWFLLFLSLFWLRQLFNFCTGLPAYFKNGNFPESNDEVKLATYLGWNEISISLTTAIIALAICTWLFFRFIPKAERFTFICSGLAGGSLGFFLWLRLLGPVILP